MRVIKWISKFLESYARETLLQKISKLEDKNKHQAQTIREQRAYIAGLKESLNALKQTKLINKKEV